MSKNLYVVPHDFTSVGDAALRYALFLSEKIKVEIQLLHVVDEKSKIQAAKSKLEKIVSDTVTPQNIVLTSKVKVGSIFEDIGKMATEEHAQLIIMGTHGEKGMQKIFGSYAMKVITSCEIPFLVVQDNTKVAQIKDIVVPIDLTKESLQIVHTAGDLARIFDATVHVVGEKQSDELLNQQMKNRILIVKKEYIDSDVKCSVEFMKDGGSYSKKIIRYCERHDIDLIAIAYHSESLIPQFDKFAQNLITNPNEVPCMVVNSKQASALYF